MEFRNPDGAVIADLLHAARIIAVVGLSQDPSRPSYRVARAMRDFGYRIVPVNPTLAAWEGGRAWPSLEAAAAGLAPGERIDIVDVFRRPEHVRAIVDDCVRLRLPALWLQLGVIDEAAALRAHRAGLTVIMDRCILVERRAIP